MGRVWLARDEMLDRDVAVKEFVPPAWMSDEEKGRLRTRTLREARSAARLNHPHVVRIYDVVHADGLPWIVMEYIESRSLFQVVREDGPFSPGAAARIGLAVLDALTAAHRAGVLHRDVKPHNVLIGHDGRVVLTDFGLATFVDEGSVTGPGMIVGSPHYVSPERARDGASTVESDLWSLGATLYAAVEARSPYARESVMATLLALASAEPDPPVLAGPLAPVLLGLLRREPADRLTAAEVAERLAEIVAVAEGRGPAPARRRAMLGLTVPAPRRPGRVADPATADDGAVRRWIAGRGRTATVFPASAGSPPNAAPGTKAVATPGAGTSPGAAPGTHAASPAGANSAGAERGQAVRLTDPAERNASPASAVPPRQRPGNHPPRAAGRLRSAVPPATTGPAAWERPPPATGAADARLRVHPDADPSAPSHRTASPAASATMRIEREGKRPRRRPDHPQTRSTLPGSPSRTVPSSLSGQSGSPGPSSMPGSGSLPASPGSLPAPARRRPPRRPPHSGGQARRSVRSRLVAAGMVALAVLGAASDPARPAQRGDHVPEVLPVVSAERMPGSLRLPGQDQQSGPSAGQGGADGFSPTICGNPPSTDLPRTPQRGAGRGADGWTLIPGWSYFTDAPGFRLAVPDGWTYERIGSTVCFRDPESDRYLGVDPDRDPAADPVQALRTEADRLRGTGRLPGYEQLGIEPVPLLTRAADWEFRYDGPPGAPVHLMARWLDLGGRAYTLSWASPEPGWVDGWDTYATIRGTFSLHEPPGGPAGR
ncbi:protein kinase domain-containing protein [Krasilnikovia cinnamomea]